MNPLNSLLNIFRKKPSASTETNDKWMRGYNAFKAGKKHFAEHRNQEAIECFDTAIECGFEDVTVFCLRGSCLQTLEWHLDAIDDFTMAISLEPQDCNLFFQRAMAKSSTGDQQGFLTDIEDAIRLSKAETTLNRNYNLGAKDMGHESTTAMYKAQAALLSDSPDFIIKKSVERTMLRGRRKQITS